MKISVHLVTWNGAKYVPHLFSSLREQTFKDWTLRVLDNGSTDGMVEAMRVELMQFPVPYAVQMNTANTGFAVGHNQLIRETLFAVPEYVLLVNQDMVLAPDYMEKLIAFMDAHPDVGAVSGRLMKWDFSAFATGASLAQTKTNHIDTLGLRVFKNRRVIDDHSGEEWNGGEEAIEVFGVSGALPLYRAAAIKSILYNDEFFDRDFFSYKEDVDVAFRLRQAGWHAFIVTGAAAWHDRSAAGPETDQDLAVIRNRRRKSAIANFYSYRNHLLMLFKNEYVSNFARDYPVIKWYELKKTVYLFFVEPQTLWLGWWQILRLLPRMLKKRKVIVASRKISAKDMCVWFT